MIFHETQLSGVYLIEPERVQDERGFFARVYCEEEFGAKGLHTSFVQCNVSYNQHRGTLRGMHYQADPYGEIKLVRCTMGAIYDVLLDLRPESPTYCQWIAEELSAENRKMFYVPTGIAHGFQTLVDDTEVFYMMGEFYHPQSASGVRWDDPTFAIEWPAVERRIISGKDQAYEDFSR